MGLRAASWQIGRAGSSRHARASLLLLGGDLALFLLLLRLGAGAFPAALASCAAGILLYGPALFRRLAADHGAVFLSRRRRQKAAFRTATLVMLAVTAGVMTLAPLFGAAPLVAKIVAMTASFAFSMPFRHQVVLA